MAFFHIRSISIVFLVPSQEPACDGLVTISWGLFCLLPFLGKFCVQIVGGFVLGVHLFCLEPLNKCENKVRT